MKEFDRFICGDALAELRKLPAESIDMCMTSPPYFGLRNYKVEQLFGGDKDCEHEWGDELKPAGYRANDGRNKPALQEGSLGTQDRDKWTPSNTCLKCQAWKGQLGLEPNPEFYIEHLTEIFNEVKRVLKKEGTFWLNISDTYAGSGGAGGDYNKGGLREGQPRFKQGQTKLQPKCLCMIPERLSWSLIQDGWILRNKNIWHKRNSMPSSVKDRFSNTYEFVYMFSKNQRYFFDLNSVREPLAESTLNDIRIGCKTGREGKKAHKLVKLGIHGGGGIGDPNKTRAELHNPLGKNPGDVFEIATQPFPEAHFAVFPEKLCEKPIKAGCPEEVCKKCGKAKKKIYKPKFTNHNGQTKTSYNKKTSSAGRLAKLRQAAREKGGEYQNERKFVGYINCDCNAGFEPGVVLDPFAGAGTVGVVAKRMGRRFILIDIKEEYMKMAERRVAQVGHQKELFK